MSWYLWINSEQIGPISDEEMAARLEDRSVTGEDMCWREGMADWQPIASVRPTAPPPLPAQSDAPGLHATNAVGADPPPLPVETGSIPFLSPVEPKLWFRIVTLASSAVGLVLGLYCGFMLAFLIPSGVLSSLMVRKLKPKGSIFIIPICLQGAYFGWLIFGMLLSESVPAPILVDLAVMLLTVLWLALRPGLLPVIVTFSYHLLGLISHALTIVGVPAGSAVHKSLTLQIALHLFILVALPASYSAFRKGGLLRFTAATDRTVAPPPSGKRFTWRKNGAAFGTVVLLSLGWIFYGEYREKGYLSQTDLAGAAIGLAALLTVFFFTMWLGNKAKG